MLAGVWGACAAIHALSRCGQDACDACHVPCPWVLAGCCCVLWGVGCIFICIYIYVYIYMYIYICICIYICIYIYTLDKNGSL